MTTENQREEPSWTVSRPEEACASGKSEERRAERRHHEGWGKAGWRKGRRAEGRRTARPESGEAAQRRAVLPSTCATCRRPPSLGSRSLRCWDPVGVARDHVVPWPSAARLPEGTRCAPDTRRPARGAGCGAGVGLGAPAG